MLSDSSYDASSFGESAELAGGCRSGVEARRIPGMQDVFELLGEKMELTHADEIILSSLVAYVIVSSGPMSRDIAEEGFLTSVNTTGGGR